MSDVKYGNENPNMKRVNIRVPLWLDEYFSEKSKLTGVSKSALMYMALEEWFKQQQMVSTLPALVKKLGELENKITV